MNSGELSELKRAVNRQGPPEALAALIARLRGAGEYERMFDALLMKARWELGLSVCAPTRLQNVPEEKREEFEESYIAAAREVGQGLLAAGNVPRAWIYFRTIGEVEPVAGALETIDTTDMEYEPLNELIEIALQDGANRVAGLRMLLASHGTCNTITTTDHVLPMMTPEERRATAAMLVQNVYDDLRGNLAHVVTDRDGGDRSTESIRSLITDRPWLFEDGGYHIDVSHLNATVRFARGLTAADAELPLAVELAEYGERLDRDYHFPNDPPFDDYYPAHQAFLRALGGIDREASLGYFRGRLETEQEERDRQVTAYVLVDLLTCCDMREEAAEIAARYLGEIEEPNGFSFAALCAETGRLDLLESVAEERNDAVAYTAALIERQRLGAGA